MVFRRGNRLTQLLFAVAARAEAVELIEAIHFELPAPVEIIKVTPIAAAVAIAVAIACPSAHCLEGIVCIRLPFLGDEGKGTRSVREEVASGVGDIAVAERHVQIGRAHV